MAEELKNITNNESYDEELKFARNFDSLQKIILRNLNDNPASPIFQKYTKADIIEYLKDPYRNQKAIRDAVIYMYGASPTFWRIIQYFASLSDLSYVLSLDNVDVTKANLQGLKKNRVKTMSFLNSMNLKTQLREILTVAWREDVYYATCWLENDKITIQQLPSDYCSTASIEDNVINVTFDFSYFNGRNEALLEYYPKEFTTKYNLYVKNRRGMRYQDLDSPASFAIKVNRDIKNYAMPPLMGLLISLYDLADFQDLLLSKTELENYALLVMKLSMTGDQYDIPYNQAKGFWNNLSDVLPDQVGAILSPMNVDKIDFKDDGADAAAAVEKAENGIFTAAGVSSLLFNNPKASANALLLSIKADQAITYSIVQSIGDAINRILKYYSFAKNYKIKFLDVSRFNREEMANQYLKAATYGLPTISMYCATVGLDPDEIDSMNYLENDMLELVDKFKPLQSSNTMASYRTGTGTGDGGVIHTGRVGRPRKNREDLTDEGETNQEYE